MSSSVGQPLVGGPDSVIVEAPLPVTNWSVGSIAGLRLNVPPLRTCVRRTEGVIVIPDPLFPCVLEQRMVLRLSGQEAAMRIGYSELIQLGIEGDQDVAMILRARRDQIRLSQGDDEYIGGRHGEHIFGFLADIDGDGNADFQIDIASYALGGPNILHARDFVL